jgi:hypothetical protein
MMAFVDLCYCVSTVLLEHHIYSYKQDTGLAGSYVGPNRSLTVVTIL